MTQTITTALNNETFNYQFVEIKRKILFCYWHQRIEAFEFLKNLDDNTCDIVEYSLHDEGAGGLPGVDSAGDDDELLVSDVVDWIGAGDGEDGDIITSQSLTQHLLLHILSSLRVIHDLLQVQHHIRISEIIKFNILFKNISLITCMDNSEPGKPCPRHEGS